MKIGFFYPSNGVGGAQLLFARLARYLILNTNFNSKVYYFDFKDGFSAELLNEEKINFIHIIIEKGKNFVIPDEIVLVVPFDIDTIRIIQKYGFYNKVKFLFYFIEPNMLLTFFHSTKLSKLIGLKATKILASFFLARRFNNIRKLLTKSLNLHGLLFMDTENCVVPGLYYLFDRTKIELLPIPVPFITDRLLTDNKSSSEEINLFWIGNIVKQKYYSLIRIIDDFTLNLTLNGKKVNLNIIGDGPYLEDIKKHTRDFSNQVYFYGAVSPDKMNELIISKCDILFAMGTSALEGGKLGFPTVLMDILSKNESNYKYKWLYETKGYTLGKRKADKTNQHTFSEILNILKSEELRDCISILNQNYTKAHDIDNVGKLFIEKLKACENTVTYDQFKIS